QYGVHTQDGVETSREESGAYRALVFGRRFLVVRTAGAASPVAEGKLVPWPAELESQLFDSKEMRSLRSSFYPFYLDGESFRRPGYVVIAVGIVFLLLFLDVLWAYKKITKHSVNFIPTGKTYEAIIQCYGGNATIPGKEKNVHELLEYVQQRAPWAIYGYSDDLSATFTKRQQDFANS